MCYCKIQDDTNDSFSVIVNFVYYFCYLIVVLLFFCTALIVFYLFSNVDVSWFSYTLGFYNFFDGREENYWL